MKVFKKQGKKQKVLCQQACAEILRTTRRKISKFFLKMEVTKMLINFVISPFIPNMNTEQLYSPSPTCYFPLIIHFLGRFLQTPCQPSFHPSLLTLPSSFNPTPVLIWYCLQEATCCVFRSLLLVQQIQPAHHNVSVTSTGEWEGRTNTKVWLHHDWSMWMRKRTRRREIVSLLVLQSVFLKPPT